MKSCLHTYSSATKNCCHYFSSKTFITFEIYFGSTWIKYFYVITLLKSCFQTIVVSQCELDSTLSGFLKKRILQIDNLRHDLKMFEYHVGGMNNSHADCRCAFCRSGHRYSDAKTENVLNTKRDGTIVVLYGRKYYI